MNILLLFLLSYLIINVAYFGLFGIASLIPAKTAVLNTPEKIHTIAVFIPAYKEDAVIYESALKATQHNYPSDKLTIAVIADQLHSETLSALTNLPIKLIQLSAEKSSKSRALNEALRQLSAHDLAVVLDADNHMKPGFLHEINNAYALGKMAMQGQRLAKNAENSHALLDAISEGINTNIFRKGHQQLGLSSALVGSGMAFDFQLFKEHMSQIEALGGFDKELELSILKEHIKITFLPEAQILDEKVSSNKSFSNQRTRWIAAQIKYGIQAILPATKALVLHQNIDYFDKAFQFLLLPRLLLLGALGTATIASLLLFSAALNS
ncbi:MAG: cellulose synthase/poly-beta-1,6-N-acetylglucosamine synthase-like glycosyltransferase, partial [Cyclobacteriaceae bacterium]